MSIRVMTRVWEHSKAKGTNLVMMLALADHADDDGWCFPGIARLARKCRISERSAQRLIAEQEEAGELIRTINKGVYVPGERGPGHTNRYRITVKKGVTDLTEGGDKSGQEGGDKSDEKGVTDLTEGGDKSDEKGVTRMTPKPSEKNRQEEPSGETSGGQPPEPPPVAEAAVGKAPTPAKTPKPDKGKPQASAAGLEFATWFRVTLPKDLDVPPGSNERWGRVFDDLVRIDKRTDAEIREVCLWARGDSFWSQHFFTPAKLRQKARGQELTYFAVWKQQMKTPGRPKTGAAAKAEEAKRTFPMPQADRDNIPYWEPPDEASEEIPDWPPAEENGTEPQNQKQNQNDHDHEHPAQSHNGQLEFEPPPF